MIETIGVSAKLTRLMTYLLPPVPSFCVQTPCVFAESAAEVSLHCLNLNLLLPHGQTALQSLPHCPKHTHQVLKDILLGLRAEYHIFYTAIFFILA